MNRAFKRNMFRKILVPMLHGCEFHDALQVAQGIASKDSIVLAGIVSVPDDSSLSAGALPAQELRKTFRQIKSEHEINSLELIRVTYDSWSELLKVVREEKPDLMVLEAGHCQMFGLSIHEVLKKAPCNIVVACGVMPAKDGPGSDPHTRRSECRACTAGGAVPGPVCRFKHPHTAYHSQNPQPRA